MAFQLSNFNNATMPDPGDANPAAQSQISDSAEPQSLTVLFNAHAHTGGGDGAQVSMANLAAAVLNMANNQITGIRYLTFEALGSTADIPNNSLGRVGDGIFYRDSTGGIVQLN